MLGFNYEKFKNALKAAELKKQEELKQDIEKVKTFIEKVLTHMLENTAHMAKTNYPGIEL